MDRGDQALCALLHERIRSRGPMPFVEFMEAALYHPAHGYYCRPGATTGPGGDFYTSADVHPAFGLLLSRQIAEIARLTSPEGPFHVIECGPGTGRLARDIIAGLAAEQPDLARRTIYTLVEISSVLMELQRRTLHESGVTGRLAGHGWASWADLLERRPGLMEVNGRFTGCVVANEFLDALPVHLVEWRGSELKEVHVDAGETAGHGFREVLIGPAGQRLTTHLEELGRAGVRLAEGQRAEFGLRGLDWVSSLARLFDGAGENGAGGAILIDYGHAAHELYDTRRHSGTLLCYHRHQVVDDPYARVGLQDMTAHIDFTSVEARARAAGLDVAPVTTQLRFLVAMGLPRLIADLADDAGGGVRVAREKLALHGLMAPGGMGEVFKVMLLARGAEAAGLTGAGDPFARFAAPPVR